MGRQIVQVYNLTAITGIIQLIRKLGKFRAILVHQVVMSLDASPTRTCMELGDSKDSAEGTTENKHVVILSPEFRDNLLFSLQKFYILWL